MMLSVKDLLELAWAELIDMPEFREVVEKGLGEKGPRKHRMMVDGSGNRTGCLRCGSIRGGNDSAALSFSPSCPVPPPITDSVEVVAERLMREVVSLTNFEAVIREINHKDELLDLWIWYTWTATPAQRVVVCLLALNLIGK